MGSLKYIIFIVYIMYVINPIIPVIDYIVRYDYYAKVLCENRPNGDNECCGKCQVVKQVTSQSEQNGKKNSPESRVLSIVEVDVHILLSCCNECIPESTHSIAQKTTSLADGNTSLGHKRKPYAPPRLPMFT